VVSMRNGRGVTGAPLSPTKLASDCAVFMFTPCRSTGSFARRDRPVAMAALCKEAICTRSLGRPPSEATRKNLVTGGNFQEGGSSLFHAGADPGNCQHEAHQPRHGPSPGP